MFYTWYVGFVMFRYMILQYIIIDSMYSWRSLKGAGDHGKSVSKCIAKVWQGYAGIKIYVYTYIRTSLDPKCSTGVTCAQPYKINDIIIKYCRKYKVLPHQTLIVRHTRISHLSMVLR